MTSIELTERHARSAETRMPVSASAATTAVQSVNTPLEIVDKIEHFAMSSVGALERREPMDQADFNSFLPDEQSGVHVFFMPSVKEITEKSPKWSNLRSTLDLRYDVPWFWFEYLGWNFNGFYTGKAKTVGNDGGIKHIASARYLVKQIHNVPVNTELPVGFDFSWDFLAFHSIWYSKTKDRQPSLVLLCFDLAGGEEPGRERSGQGTLLGEYKQHIADSVTNKALQDPFEIHALMLRQLLRIIDKTVWNFRKPLKALEEEIRPENEKAREPKKSRKEKIAVKQKKTELYYYLPGLLRHVTHGIETITAAVSSVERMEKDCREFVLPLDGQAHPRVTESTSEELSCCVLQLRNLRMRAESNEKRLTRQPRRVFHQVDLENVAISQLILEEMQDNDQELTRFLTRLTVIFLPPTFTAGFFGMTFSNSNIRACGYTLW
ncbi:hypothetical protein C1H76_6816 [Elsinoe australis]|uniref:Uncharacterized protein n=1 Tax=Elsinoe australis TaxID=40998 RepID=A0A4U7AUY1_9PEZI|nr:hypothetical protein C1H76_6816 [Elsinoe australis]